MGQKILCLRFVYTLYIVSVNLFNTHSDIVAGADSMWKSSVFPSVISASLGAKYLKEGGLISLPGAQPALNGTPGGVP